MEEQILSRVHVLMAHNRFAEAEALIKDLLSTDSSNAYVLSLLAEVSIQQNKVSVAREAVDQAIALSPSSDDLFYLKSRICLLEDDYQGAEKYIRQAIELEPLDSDNFALLAAIQLDKKQFAQALETADEALRLNPENLFALNTRSNVLIKLNRSEESFVTIEGALREDPDNYYTHTNYGWSLLENGDYKAAQMHFKQALQKNPNYEYAQSGMSEAIKAGNPVYRLFLKYSFFMQNLTSRNQWAVIIVFFIVIKVLRGVAKNNEALQPYLTPIVIGLSLIAFLTWIIAPVANLFLSFHPYGKYLLSNKEKLSSKFVAVSFGLFIAGLISFIITALEEYLSVTIFGFAMMLPISNMFTPAKYKHLFLIYTLVLSLVGIGAVVITFLQGVLFNGLSLLFVLGFVAFQWAANFFMIKNSNK